jgi:heme/copper-type cytochrome/quinol oxidase subunit 2
MLIKVKSQKPKAKSIRSKFLWLFAYCLLPIASIAQCAMCRAALESSGNNAKVEAVNDGIVFLMAIPYIIVAGIGFVVYKMYYNKK